MDATALRTYKIPILLGGVSVLAIIVSIVLLVKSNQTAATPIQFSSDIPEASSSATLTVDVEGAVVHPGVYTLPVGSRVEDVITAAGGLESDADEELFAKTMNRAMKLVDGGKIYVPSFSSSGLGSVSSLGNLVSVNTASQSELEALPGIGPVTAKKIIANRPYQTLEELVAKKAVGTALFGKIKDTLSL
jgi:competence protein ComEA